MPLRFGDCVFDRSARTLTRDGRPVEITLKAFELLSTLLENRPRPLSKAELHERLWPKTFVSDTSLARLVSELRKAIGDNAKHPRLVRTLHGYGYAFHAPVTGGPATRLAADAVNTVVVLPFVDLGEDPNQDYFCDGLTEEIINELGRLRPRGLRVIARTSAMQYKGSDKSVREIGHELGVEHALEGSVRRAGSRVRISAQLVRVADQLQVWSGSYDADLGDMVAVQREVVSALANEIWPELAPPHTHDEPRRLDPEAYELYLKGRYFWHRRTAPDLWKGVGCFERAIEKVPSYATAHTGLADIYLTLLDYQELDAREAMKRAKIAIADALRLDPGLAEAHSTLGHLSIHAFDWAAAESAFVRALEINPSYAMAHFYFANYLVAMARFDEAIEEGMRAIRLDPVAAIVESNSAFVYYHARRFDEALECCRRALEMDADLWVAHYDLGRVRVELGEYREAIEALEKAVELSVRSQRALAALGHAYAIAGKRAQAEEILRRLRQPRDQRFVWAYGVAVVLLALDRTDEAFDLMERAHDELDAGLVFLKVDPRLRVHRDHPRARSLLRRMRFEG